MDAFVQVAVESLRLANLVQQFPSTTSIIKHMVELPYVKAMDIMKANPEFRCYLEPILPLIQKDDFIRYSFTSVNKDLGDNLFKKFFFNVRFLKKSLITYLAIKPNFC